MIFNKLDYPEEPLSRLKRETTILRQLTIEYTETTKKAGEQISSLLNADILTKDGMISIIELLSNLLHESTELASHLHRFESLSLEMAELFPSSEYELFENINHLMELMLKRIERVVGQMKERLNFCIDLRNTGDWITEPNIKSGEIEKIRKAILIDTAEVDFEAEFCKLWDIVEARMEILTQCMTSSVYEVFEPRVGNNIDEIDKILKILGV